jgi:hypothetical protein
MAYCDKIYMPIFMKIVAGVQVVLRFGLGNSSITDESDFSNYATEMGSGVMIYTYEIS